MSFNRRDFLIWASAFACSNSFASSNLQTQINNYVQKQRKIGRLNPSERTAWTVYDIHAQKSLVAINGTRSMQCASMIKPLILLAYLHYNFYFSSKKFPLNSIIIKEMEDVIVRSSNKVTNRFISRLGGIEITNKILHKAYPKLFKQLQLVEYIPANGRAYRNKASAADYERFLWALWHERLPHAKLLKYLLGLKNSDRLKTNTKNIPKEALIYDKTGSTAMLCGNTGIIVAKNKKGLQFPYIITGIIENKYRAKNYKNWIQNRGNLIREVSDLTYIYLRTKYQLV